MKIGILVGVMFFSLHGLAQQEVKLMKLDELMQLVEEDSDKLRVINFWASWCGPCIKELPYFDAINTKTDVEVYLISLDFVQDREKAERMIQKSRIESPAYLLDEKDYDKYITRINSDWSGAIPATLFVDSSGRKVFHEKAFEKAELEQIVENLTAK